MLVWLPPYSVPPSININDMKPSSKPSSSGSLNCSVKNNGNKESSTTVSFSSLKYEFETIKQKNKLEKEVEIQERQLERQIWNFLDSMFVSQGFAKLSSKMSSRTWDNVKPEVVNSFLKDHSLMQAANSILLEDEEIEELQRITMEEHSLFSISTSTSRRTKKNTTETVNDEASSSTSGISGILPYISSSATLLLSEVVIRSYSVIGSLMNTKHTKSSYYTGEIISDTSEDEYRDDEYNNKSSSNSGWGTGWGSTGRKTTKQKVDQELYDYDHQSNGHYKSNANCSRKVMPEASFSTDTDGDYPEDAKNYDHVLACMKKSVKSCSSGSLATRGFGIHKNEKNGLQNGLHGKSEKLLAIDMKNNDMSSKN